MGSSSRDGRPARPAVRQGGAGSTVAPGAVPFASGEVPGRYPGLSHAWGVERQGRLRARPARSARRTHRAGRARRPGSPRTTTNPGCTTGRASPGRGWRPLPAPGCYRSDSPAAPERPAGRCRPSSGRGAARTSCSGQSPVPGPGRGRSVRGAGRPGCRTAPRSAAARGWAASPRPRRAGSCRVCAPTCAISTLVAEEAMTGHVVVLGVPDPQVSQLLPLGHRATLLIEDRPHNAAAEPATVRLPVVRRLTARLPRRLRPGRARAARAR